MRRLYLQVYLTIVASLVLVVLTAGLLWHFIGGIGPFGPQFEVLGEVIADLVPPGNAPAQAQQQAIDRLAGRLGADVALFSATNEPLAAAGRPLPAPSRDGRSGGWMRTGAGPAVSIPLPDGRRLVARLPGRQRPSALTLPAISLRASRSRAATRLPVWLRASISPPLGSKAWSTRTRCCSPTHR